VFLDTGYLVVVLALLQAVIASAILILAPLAWLRSGEERRVAPGPLQVAFYFLLIGFAFLFVEIAFIHRITLFLGQPLAAIAVTLAGFLVSAGLGSGISKRVAARWPQAAIILAVAAIVGLGVVYAMVLPPVFDGLMGLPLSAKIAVAVGLLAPFGVRHGSAISARAQSCLRLRPRPSTVGLGHQRLRVGRRGCNGQPARHACRVHHRAGSCSQPLHRDAAPARAGPARGVSVQGGRAAREHALLARKGGYHPRGDQG